MIRLTLVAVLSFSVGILITVTAQEWVDHKKPSIRQDVYEAVMCPLNWTHQITQEYDDRNSRGEIIKRTRIRKCA